MKLKKSIVSKKTSFLMNVLLFRVETKNTKYVLSIEYFSLELKNNESLSTSKLIG